MRLMLDTNIWSYIARDGLENDIRVLEEGANFRIVIPPSILLEVIRTSDPGVRERIVRTMTMSIRDHPLPEAKQLADELISEARRLRPQWIVPMPFTAELRPLERFWSKRIWQSAAADPEAFAVAESQTETASVANALLEQQRQNKAAVMASPIRVDEGEPFYDISQSDEDLKTGWRGGRIPLWRVEGRELWWHSLRILNGQARRGSGNRSLADWAEPYLRISSTLADVGSWNQFWFYEVDPGRMPRNWISAVTPFVQLHTKVTDGNPRDVQHASYLFDVDLFMTADRRYANTLEIVRKWSPVPFASVRIVRPSEVTEALIEEASNLRNPPANK